MEHLRALLDKYMNTSNMTDIEVVQVIEAETMKRDSFIKLEHLIKKHEGVRYIC